MAKKKSSQWRSTATKAPGDYVYAPNGLLNGDIPIPSMEQVKEFLAAVRPPTNGLVSITHALVENGTVSERYYQVALAGGMTHYNPKTGNFAVMV
jgi:hypothetical protein